MPLYITVREGPAADRAEPLLATGDERVVRAVLDALAHIMFETATSSWAHRRRNAPLRTSQLHLIAGKAKENDETQDRINGAPAAVLTTRRGGADGPEPSNRVPDA
jgi:hypothetical protein